MRPPLPPRLIACCLLLLCGACSPGQAQDAPAPVFTLRAGWSAGTALQFEQWLTDELPGTTPRRLAPDALNELRQSLAGTPNRATRASLVLALSLDPAGYEVLLAHLEERRTYPARPDDSGACTAATALGRRPLAERTADRLVELAAGERPHPDLEVRTECALSALDLGREEVLPFLVRVLRIDTPSAAREGALTDSLTTAWPRGRAAEGLCAFLELPHQDWTDAPIQERERRADDLEERLAARQSESPR